MGIVSSLSAHFKIDLVADSRSFKHIGLKLQTKAVQKGPDYLQSKHCSRPESDSEVECRAPSRVQTRILRAPTASSTAETAKNLPSPIHLHEII